MTPLDRDTLKFLYQRWRLTADGLPFHTHSSLLQSVIWQGKPAMLKVAHSDEERHGATLMQFWNGVGAARVYAHEGDAILLERGATQPSLTAMVEAGDDDKASRIICDVAAQLHAVHGPRPPTLTPLAQRFSALFTAAARQNTYAGAAAIATELLAQPEDLHLLHGDLHHQNILSGPRGWMAIDPKGMFGERGFDFANILCNPSAHIVCAPGRLQRQIAVITEAAQLDPQRLLAWVAAWSGLSAVWLQEDHGDPDSRLSVMTHALELLRPKVSVGQGWSFGK